LAKITIFGQAGTGTTTVGEKLAKIIDYTFLSSGNLFREKAKELRIKVDKFEQICINDPKYDLELDKKVLDFGKRNDNIVVDSRLAYHFIPDSTKVKLICNYYIRVKRVANRDGGVPFSVASNKINDRESAAAKRYRKLYGISRLGSDNKFDLIIETSHRSVSEIATIIISKFKLPIIGEWKEIFC